MCLVCSYKNVAPNMISLNIAHSKDFVDELQYSAMLNDMQALRSRLLNYATDGTEFTGWVHLPTNIINSNLLTEIKICADKFKKLDAVVVIGVGGSYLGSKAVINALNPYFKNKDLTEILFAGFNFSEQYISELITYLNDKNFGIVVVSKSGTTTEPALAFRQLKALLESKVGAKHAANQIVAVTDANKGALRKLATDNDYQTFDIDDNIGGRYSVLSAVGLLPIAIAGFDIDALINGACTMQQHCIETSGEDNLAFSYASTRNLLYKSGKKIEISVAYEDKLRNILEWWKQLYGESEGKNLKGIFTSSALFTTDLHSIGQMIQDGERNIFETILWIKQAPSLLSVSSDDENLDGLNYLAGKSISEINHKAMQGTLAAHVEGGVPNIIIELEKLDEFNMGQLLYFYQFACALSGYCLGVNPFDQPGVEFYKRNMFKLLGK